MNSIDEKYVEEEKKEETSKNKEIIKDKNTDSKEIEKFDSKEEKEPTELDRSVKSKKEKLYKSDEKTDNSMIISVTEIKTNDTEDKCTGSEGEKLVKVNPNNPRITISEPVDSPCGRESSQQKPSQPSGQCHVYYGIKSYIHDFYQPPDKEIFKSGEYIQGDDFQWVVEPDKRRWKGCWFRAGLWLGVNLMLLGIIAMLVGHLTTPRETIVSQQDDCTVLDHWAVTFNNRLVICQLAGLAGFTCGAVIVMLALLVSSYHQEQTHGYYVVAATVVPQKFVGTPMVGPRQWCGTRRIPLSGYVSGVQPVFVRSH